jgi:hypothetical protein
MNKGFRITLLGLAILLLTLTSIQAIDYQNRPVDPCPDMQKCLEMLRQSDAWYDRQLEIRIEIWKTRIQF